MTTLTALATSERQAQLRRAAEHRRLGLVPDWSAQDEAPAVVLRLARPDERALVSHLAALDDAPALRGRVLLALVADEAVAALSLSDGRVVANPFVGTRDAVALLRLRAAHLLGKRPRRQWWAILRSAD
jgi:hypothetical protein